MTIPKDVEVLETAIVGLKALVADLDRKLEPVQIPVEYGPVPDVEIDVSGRSDIGGRLRSAVYSVECLTADVGNLKERLDL